MIPGMFIRAWLVPRVAFWAIWTAWLWVLQTFLLDRMGHSAGHATLLLVVAPPIVLTFLGSRLAKNTFESPMSLFWKGAAVSFALAAYANVCMMPLDVDGTVMGTELLVVAFFITGYLAIRGQGIRKVQVASGDLFERCQALARKTGLASTRVIVFTSPRDTPAAFSARTGAVLLSDRLLRVLSRRETDAVIAHEIAHQTPGQRMLLSVLPFLAGLSILISAFFPAVKLAAPFVPIAAVLLWRAIRRFHEYDADATAVHTTNDAEALIAALARVVRITEMPLDWGRAAGLFLSHPPMSARFRAIAKKGGIKPARVDDIVASTALVPSLPPALPGYASPFANLAPPVTGLLAAHHDRIRKRMGLLSKLFPILAGVAVAFTFRKADLDFMDWIAVTAEWTIASVIVYFVLYEVVVGLERARVRDQLSRDPDGFFVGLATAAEPRIYDDAYHYDLGIAKIDGASLIFTGARSSFTMGSGQVRRVWLGDGPRHWTPRKTVCIEYLVGETIAVVSLQSFERWFWPATATAAQQLLSAIKTWCEGPRDVRASVAPPQVTGSIVPVIKLSSVWKPVQIYAMISLAVSWTISLASINVNALFVPFCAPIVTAALVLFAVAPHLQRGPRGHSKAITTSQPEAQ